MATKLHASGVDSYLLTQRAHLDELLKSSSLWQKFKDMPSYLKDFLCLEKNHVFHTDESRYAIDVQGKKLTGFTHSYTRLEHPYDPESWQPFIIKGVWIPAEHGRLFKSKEDLSKVEREAATGKECLFLIHPISEPNFSSLLERYQPIEEFVALALSSARSLLVSFPSKQGESEFGVVKVSLDKEIGGVNRKLSYKECGASIFNSWFAARKELTLDFFSEEFSFVPSMTTDQGGMIFRSLSVLSHHKDRIVAPLYALLGSQQSSFLQSLVKTSGLSAEDFLENAILNPLAHLWVNLLFKEKISLEFHAQNLLFSLSKDGKEPIRFLYRDFGGMNIPSFEKAGIPEEFSWSENYLEDVSKLLEHFSYKVLFNFTKLFFNQEVFYSQSPRFVAWREEMILLEYDKNWVVRVDEQIHLCEVPLRDFCRYGYFEKRFALMFLNQMHTLGVFEAFKERGICVTKEDLEQRLINPSDIFSSCVDLLWFEELIMKCRLLIT